MPVAKAMELEMKYKSLAKDGLLSVISDPRDKAICEAASKICKGNYDDFYGALMHVLRTDNY